MASETSFGNAILFLKDLGMYDVVLPFILVFTIVYAIFDKTRVLGEEDIAGKKYPKKNLNAMIAFVIAFLVVASTKIVGIINEALANIVLLMLVAVFFLVLVSVFYKEGSFELDASWKTFMLFFMFLGVIAIFLWAIKVDSNVTYCGDYPAGQCPFLVTLWGYLNDHWDSRIVGSIFLGILIIGFIWWVTQPVKEEGKKESK